MTSFSLSLYTFKKNPDIFVPDYYQYAIKWVAHNFSLVSTLRVMFKVYCMWLRVIPEYLDILYIHYDDVYTLDFKLN